APPLERREFFEFFEAAIDLLSRQRAKTFHAKALATEAAHHRPVNYRAPEFVHVHIMGFEIDARAREIAHESTGETIARASGIENIFEQVAGHHEVFV